MRIGAQADKYPAQLSGGQQQRVAIARALCMQPKEINEQLAALGRELDVHVQHFQTKSTAV